MTDEEIKEWADAYGCNRHESELLKRGAKYHREQSDAKLKELINHYTYIIKVADIAINSTKGQYETKEHFQDRMENLKIQKLNYETFIEQLNAIIEP